MNKWYLDIGCLFFSQFMAGCSNEKKVPIYEHFYAPDSFSPNGDGLNDFFYIIKPNYVQLQKFHISIYDGSLKLMYESDEITKAWDGNYNSTGAPVGFYDYQIIYTASTDSVHYEDYVTSSRLNLFR
jgi:gliding motility-associated-like protein